MVSYRMCKPGPNVLSASLATISLLHLIHADNLADMMFCLALLMGTLRTYQRAGCDDETVTLRCPPGTCISVQVAQYGKSAPSLCPSLENFHHNANLTCLWPSALQTVVEACHKKRQCLIHPSANTFGGDPCPGLRKYVEIAYKCRPYEFRSKVACENDVLQLACNPNYRLAIYSASFGRTEYESVRCPQPQGVREETCLVSYATESVLQICHGKRKCSVPADSSTFGNPCNHQSRLYLKVIYTCVPRKVLQEQYEEAIRDDEFVDLDEEYTDYDVEISVRESFIHPDLPNVAVAGRRYNFSTPKQILPPIVQQNDGYSDNQLIQDEEAVLVYLGVSAGIALVTVCVLFSVRLLWKRQQLQPSTANAAVSKGFNMEIIEANDKVDLTNVTTQPIKILPSPRIHHQPVDVMRTASVGVMTSSRRHPDDYYYG